MAQSREVSYIKKEVVLRFKEIFHELLDTCVPEDIITFKQEFLTAYNKFADKEISIKYAKQVSSDDIKELKELYNSTITKMVKCLKAYHLLSSKCKEYYDEVLKVDIWEQKNPGKIFVKNRETYEELNTLRRIKELHSLGLTDSEEVEALCKSNE